MSFPNAQSLQAFITRRLAACSHTSSCIRLWHHLTVHDQTELRGRPDRVARQPFTIMTRTVGKDIRSPLCLRSFEDGDRRGTRVESIVPAPVTLARGSTNAKRPTNVPAGYPPGYKDPNRCTFAPRKVTYHSQHTDDAERRTFPVYVESLQISTVEVAKQQMSRAPGFSAFQQRCSTSTRDMSYGRTAWDASVRRHSSHSKPYDRPLWSIKYHQNGPKHLTWAE
jgi:hypothetical protein